MNITACCILIISLFVNTGKSCSSKEIPDLSVRFVDNRIELVINNIKNNKGVIRIGMYNNDVGYPDTPSTGFTFAKDTLKSGMLRTFIPVSRSGMYAFSVLDDENENGKMDYVIGIIPREGFGFSNNPKVSRKAPAFKDTSFRFDGGLKKVEIKMVYILP